MAFDCSDKLALLRLLRGWRYGDPELGLGLVDRVDSLSFKRCRWLRTSTLGIDVIGGRGGSAGAFSSDGTETSLRRTTPIWLGGSSAGPRDSSARLLLGVGGAGVGVFETGRSFRGIGGMGRGFFAAICVASASDLGDGLRGGGGLYLSGSSSLLAE